MSEFKSVQTYSAFAHSIRRESRHILQPNCQEFLDALIATSSTRIATIEAHSLLWRAVLDHDWVDIEVEPKVTYSIQAPCKAARMMPWIDKAKEGRVNPKGIPCLYLGTDPDTAMSEVRPWVGSVISLGQFHVKRFLKVIDFSNEPQVQFSISEPSNGAERERQAWSHVANAFSQPVTPTDDVADYAPTQVIAEAIRRQGYAGIKYRSTLGAGLNVALFDPRNAQLMIRKLCDTKSVHFVFTERGNDNALERRLFELAQELQEAEEAEVLRMKSEIDR